MAKMLMSSTFYVHYTQSQSISALKVCQINLVIESDDRVVQIFLKELNRPKRKLGRQLPGKIGSLSAKSSELDFLGQPAPSISK